MAMSKLDFITILIVAICVGALGFLVYKTVKLMNPDEATPEVIENTEPAYDPADEYALDDEGDVITDDTPASDESTDNSNTPASEEDYPIADDGADLDEAQTPILLKNLNRHPKLMTVDHPPGHIWYWPVLTNRRSMLPIKSTN